MPVIFHFLISKLAKILEIIGTMDRNSLQLLSFPRMSLLLQRYLDRLHSLEFLLFHIDLKRWWPLNIWILRNRNLPLASDFAATIKNKGYFMLLMIKCSWRATTSACFKILRTMNLGKKNWNLRGRILSRTPLTRQKFRWSGRSRHMPRLSGFLSISKKLTFWWLHPSIKRWRFGMPPQANTWILFNKTTIRLLLKHWLSMIQKRATSIPKTGEKLMKGLK